MTDEMRRRQVLVVEDDPSLRNLYTTTLSRLDVDLFEAPDGAVAVDLLGAFGADVVVTDLDMPRMNGFELCEFIRADGAGLPTEVIAVTGNASAEAVARVLECGARTCLVKPFPMNRLAHEVQAAFAARDSWKESGPLPGAYAG